MKILPRHSHALLLSLVVVSSLFLLGSTACVPMNGGGNGNTNANDNDNGNQNTNDNVNDNIAGLPLSSFRTANFSGTGNCAACHNNLTDEAGNDASIADAWRATLMANAAHDPFFLASVDSEIVANPQIAAVIEDVCAKCHMPAARTQAVADGTDSLILDQGFIDPAHPLHIAAFDGVSCTVCHQIQPADDVAATFSGEYVIDASAPQPEQVIFGPYMDPVSPELMRQAVGYTPQFGSHVSDSALCATCHTLFTPVVDTAGQVTDQVFPEQVPYLEWQAGRFGDGGADDRSCQDCHMPAAEGAVAISVVPSNLTGRQPFSRHVFLGGNVFMLRMLRDNIEELGLRASTAQFNEAIALTEEFLRTQTAELEFTDLSLSGGQISATLNLRNLTGHKLPTSFPSRRVWIHLTVRNAGGNLVFESGTPLPDGRITGVDADGDASTFEPHYDVITGPHQVQVYEPVMQNTDGAVTYVLLHAASFAKDNRLLPEDFNKDAVGADIAVVGAAASDDDFLGGGDVITYQVPVTEAAGPFTVSAELLFQSVSYRFVEHLRADRTALTNAFTALYDAADKTPATIASVSATVP